MMVNTFSLIIYILLSLILINQSKKISSYKIEIKELEKLSIANENLVTTYRKTHHEYKNKLIIIKSLIHKNNKELNNYVDCLINDNIEVKDIWLNELKYIKIPSTKNLVNYKLNVLKSKNTEIELFISEELKNIKTNKLSQKKINNLNTILGVFLDNIIEEIKNSKLKQVSINIFIDNKELNIILANTFSKKPNIDEINNPNYSTKGKNRGLGLSLVNDIVKSNKNLELSTKIEDKFFVQHLKIKNINNYLK